MTICPNCNSSNSVIDEYYVIVCSDCGTVLDDLRIGEEQETEYKYGRSQIKHIKVKIYIYMYI